MDIGQLTKDVIETTESIEFRAERLRVIVENFQSVGMDGPARRLGAFAEGFLSDAAELRKSMAQTLLVSQRSTTHAA